MLEPLPTIRPPRRGHSPLARGLPPSAAIQWLRAGFADMRADLGPSLAYGVFLVALSYLVLGTLYVSGLLYLALPAVSGFLIVGPFLALGLYEKSRRRAAGQSTTLGQMLFVRPVSPSQMAYAGLLLALLVLFWLRAADLLYALFFGITPFPGAGDALANVFTTLRGWILIGVGSGVGALFASFAFAISLFSIPMLMAERGDALTAMGRSFALTAHNLPAVIAWGAIVAAGLVISLVTGFLGLAVIFPILGHGTWHVYRDLGRPEEANSQVGGR